MEFQLEDRQDIDVERFKAYWESLNGTTLPLDHPTIRVNVEDEVFDPATNTVHDFLTGPSEPPSPGESGWKDTFVAPPGKVTRVLIRFAPQYTPVAPPVPGVNPFPFDSTAGPGYVWHCHILDHEDNDMMRPMKMTAPLTSLDRSRALTHEGLVRWDRRARPSLPRGELWAVIYRMLGSTTEADDAVMGQGLEHIGPEARPRATTGGCWSAPRAGGTENVWRPRRDSNPRFPA